MEAEGVVLFNDWCSRVWQAVSFVSMEPRDCGRQCAVQLTVSHAEPGAIAALQVVSMPVYVSYGGCLRCSLQSDSLIDSSTTSLRSTQPSLRPSCMFDVCIRCICMVAYLVALLPFITL